MKAILIAVAIFLMGGLFQSAYGEEKTDQIKTFFGRHEISPLWTVAGFHFIRPSINAKGPYMSTCTFYTTFTSQVTGKLIFIGLNIRVSDLKEKKTPMWYFNIISDGFNTLPTQFKTKFSWAKLKTKETFYVDANYIMPTPGMIVLSKLPLKFINEVFSGHSKSITFELPAINDPKKVGYIRLNVLGTETALDMLHTCVIDYKKNHMKK